MSAHLIYPLSTGTYCIPFSSYRMRRLYFPQTASTLFPFNPFQEPTAPKPDARHKFFEISKLPNSAISTSHLISEFRGGGLLERLSIVLTRHKQPTGSFGFVGSHSLVLAILSTYQTKSIISCPPGLII